MKYVCKIISGEVVVNADSPDEAAEIAQDELDQWVEWSVDIGAVREFKQ